MFETQIRKLSTTELLSDILDHAKELRGHINTLKMSVSNENDKSNNSSSTGSCKVSTVKRQTKIGKSHSFPLENKARKLVSRTFQKEKVVKPKQKLISRTYTDPIIIRRQKEVIASNKVKSKSLTREIPPLATTAHSRCMSPLYMCKPFDDTDSIYEQVNLTNSKYKKVQRNRLIKKISAFKKKSNIDSSDSEENFYQKTRSSSEEQKVVVNRKYSQSDDENLRPNRVVQINKPNMITLNYKKPIMKKATRLTKKVRELKSRSFDEKTKLEHAVMQVQRENSHMIKRTLRKQVLSS